MNENEREIALDEHAASYVKLVDELAFRFSGVADFSKLPDSTQRAIYHFTHEATVSPAGYYFENIGEVETATVANHLEQMNAEAA